MNGFLNDIPLLKYVHQEKIELEQSFEDVASCFADESGTVVLLSGSGLDSSCYNILSVRPWLEITGKKENLLLHCLGKRILVEKDDLFSLIQVFLDRFKTDSGTFDLPVNSGFFGYFSYDLKEWIERLPITCIDTGLPDICLYAPSLILVQNKRDGQTVLCVPVLAHKDIPDSTVDDILDFFFERISRRPGPKSFSIDRSGFRSNFTKAGYISSVKKIIEYLKAGDIYQANFSQRFEAGFSGDSYSLFLDLFKRNPASFFSFINAGDHKIVSSSPERFIKQDGRRIETRPIKGTIERGRTEEKDNEKRLKLAKSVKDDAELTMIVDLMRNDLSRVSRAGSVIVKEHKRLEAYENVFHLVSIVEGELEKDKTSMDLLKATFPGGSITGCPKIRSMEIIDELEPVKRHVYTGSIGYVSFHETMDLSIAIRTATIVDGTVFFSVGGGIVYDSDPEKEFQETLYKGRTLMEALSNSSEKDGNVKPKAWVNGRVVDQDKAFIPAASYGFQYGAGLFETVRVEKGVPCRLDRHVSRLNKAWRALFDSPPPDITWNNVIDLLVKENNFQSDRAAVKIIISKNGPYKKEKTFSAVFARKYTHRLRVLKKKGLDLITYPYPRQTPLADHKTLNYLYYFRAGEYAGKNNADEALILNPDSTVSETNTCSIIAVRDRNVYVPESPHVLSGVTLESVLSILSGSGYRIIRKRIPKREIYSYNDIVLTNALMGAVSVLSVDGKEIDRSEDICTIINEKLF